MNDCLWATQIICDLNHLCLFHNLHCYFCYMPVHFFTLVLGVTLSISILHYFKQFIKFVNKEKVNFEPVSFTPKKGTFISGYWDYLDSWPPIQNCILCSENSLKSSQYGSFQELIQILVNYCSNYQCSNSRWIPTNSENLFRSSGNRLNPHNLEFILSPPLIGILEVIPFLCTSGFLSKNWR